MSAARSPMILAGGGSLLVLVVAAVLAPPLARYGPEALAGGALQPPSGEHLLGTNHLGQDIFSQLVWGGRDSLTVGAGAATLAVMAGTLVGVGAALLGGVADTVAMRVVDVFLGIPHANR